MLIPTLVTVFSSFPIFKAIFEFDKKWKYDVIHPTDVLFFFFFFF